jgi:hypothetical protein
MRKIKETRYLLTKWKLCEEKTTLGQPNPGNSLSKDKISVKRKPLPIQGHNKALVLTKPIAVVIHLTITQSPS